MLVTISPNSTFRSPSLGEWQAPIGGSDDISGDDRVSPYNRSNSITSWIVFHIVFACNWASNLWWALGWLWSGCSKWHFAVQKVQNLHQQTINYCLCCRSRSEVLDLSSLSYISHIVRKIKWKYRTWLNLHSHSTAGGFNKSVLLSNPYIPLKWGVLSKEKFSFEEKITYSHFIQPTTPLPVIICQNSDSLEIFSKIS